MSDRVNLNNSLLLVPVGSLIVPAHPPAPSPILLSIAIPTYKESQNIETLVSKLCYLLDPVLRDRYELIIVDDDSPDRTWEIAQSLIPQYPQLRVMRRIEERGLSTAVVRGWQVARGFVFGAIDADLQHPPEILLQLWEEIKKGADLAVASRHIEEGGVSDWNIFRRILSRGAQILGLTILPGVVGRVSDPMSGYFLVKRDAIAGKPLDPIGYKILLEVIGRGDIRCCREVGYIFQERQEGESKVTAKQYLEYIQHLLRLRRSLWPVERFLRFIAVGATGLVVDLSLFYLLRTEWGLGLTRSAILSAEVAIINNFLWNDLWTYRDKSRPQKGWKKWFKRLLKFNAICLAGLILNVLLVNILYNLLHVNEYAAKLIAIAVVTFWNFWINLKLQWRTTEIG
ncbi:glycosyltransferase family 2 protein [Oscillatoria sp. FACHB-1406]|uniref:glycosyltransferase n=1 Tax=Oscillatoria sp. FACHB-1406 TaxID=2692846 RepID=UPI001683925B|nr:glycosyltransferase family 2 protein [Oscillatoria sp. FACHB-1406]MBD2579204.1 glycosyltransferase [Oscillatoria sp. FACHB-1406]